MVSFRIPSWGLIGCALAITFGARILLYSLVWLSGVRGQPWYFHRFSEVLLVTTAGFVIVMAFIVPLIRLTWNLLVVPTFNVPRITYSQALVLAVLGLVFSLLAPW